MKQRSDVAEVHLNTQKMPEACLVRVLGRQCSVVQGFSQGYSAGEVRHGQAEHTVGGVSRDPGCAQMRWDRLLQLQALQQQHMLCCDLRVKPLCAGLHGTAAAHKQRLTVQHPARAISSIVQCEVSAMACATSSRWNLTSRDDQYQDCQYKISRQAARPPPCSHVAGDRH